MLQAKLVVSLSVGSGWSGDSSAEKDISPLSDASVSHINRLLPRYEGGIGELWEGDWGCDGVVVFVGEAVTADNYRSSSTCDAVRAA